jgi:4-hydroxyphenylpyruvate dioxygenase
MTGTIDNPLGLDGFAFCEFTSPDPAIMAKQLLALGFVAAARRPEGILFRQGRIGFVINSQEKGRAAEFRRLHGPSACGMGFHVANASDVQRLALERGAVAVETADTLLPTAYAIAGIGGSLLYLVDSGPFVTWEEVPGWREAAATESIGLDLIDHLTHNVRRGQMRVWSEFYGKLFGFEEQKYFDSRARQPACSARR